MFKNVRHFFWVQTYRSFCFVIHNAVINDGALDKSAFADEAGSEEDLYEEYRSGNHRYGHQGGGGEQLAINEVKALDNRYCLCFYMFLNRILYSRKLGVHIEGCHNTISFI